MDLFVHRDDVFAEQQESGAYFPVQSQLSELEVSEHLAGFASYGVYVVLPELQLPIRDANDGSGISHVETIRNTVKYVVFDLDTHDEEAQEFLQECCRALVRGNASSLALGTDGFPMLLLERSGNKGSHVWLFFSEPISAAKVRRWLERDFWPRWQEEATQNRWPLEVFPKQDEVATGGFGNLVKLPLGRHAVTGNFSEFVAYDGWASGIEGVVPLPSELVPEVATASVAGRGVSSSRLVQQAGDGPASPFPCVNHIQREGVGKGYREMAMFHLALYWYGHGLDQDQAEEVCNRANENFDPPLTASELRKAVRTAYTGRYAGAKCGTDWLRDVCPGPCQGGWAVFKPSEGSSLKRAEPGSALEVEVVRVTKGDGVTRVQVRHPDSSNAPTLLCEGV